MAKYWNMGLSLSDVLERCTSRPAELLGMRGIIGSLSEGARADIAILKEIDRSAEFGDCHGEIMTANRILKALATIKDGELVYRDIEF